VHTHLREAWHSAVDDQFCLGPATGFLSLGTSNFAPGPAGLVGTALARLQPHGLGILQPSGEFNLELRRHLPGTGVHRPAHRPSHRRPVRMTTASWMACAPPSPDLRWPRQPRLTAWQTALVALYAQLAMMGLRSTSLTCDKLVTMKWPAPWWPSEPSLAGVVVRRKLEVW